MSFQKCGGAGWQRFKPMLAGLSKWGPWYISAKMLFRLLSVLTWPDLFVMCKQRQIWAEIDLFYLSPGTRTYLESNE